MRNIDVKEEDVGEDDELNFDFVLFFFDSKTQRDAREAFLPTTKSSDPSTNIAI